MHDNALALEILRQIEEAARKVVQRFRVIKDPSDFSDSDAGMEKMDAICMMLIVIGESLKGLDKVTNQELLSRYPEVDWRKAMGMRDIISHHYADIDAETVYYTCQRKVPDLLNTIGKMIQDLSP
ncbi:MAG TPA: antitoxin [Desulfobacteraceae bacterium]|nr:antitoxin [Desulfobacteraceae bacterium]